MLHYISIFEHAEKEKGSLKMDEKDYLAFLGESVILHRFNPTEVFSSSDDVVNGLKLSLNEDSGTNLNDKTVEQFFPHSSKSSSKNSWLTNVTLLILNYARSSIMK